MIALLAPEITLGDGGTIQLRERVGSLLLTVFSTPVPLRVGSGDFSVMVQKSSNADVILNARVSLELAKPGQRTIAAPATRAQATNKLLFAVRVPLPSAGEWRLNLSVTANGETARASGNITVQPEQPPLRAYWPYFAIPVLMILLFLVNQWLKTKRRVRGQ